MKKRAVSVALALALCLGLVPAAFASEVQPIPSNNCAAQDSAARRNASYLYRNASDGLTRVEYDINTQRLIVEDYDSSFRVQSSRVMKPAGPVWGGFFAGAQYNFVISGWDNEQEIGTAEVIRVEKYGKDWQKLGEGSIKGINITKPFSSGSVSCAEEGGYLYVYTTRLRPAVIMTPDGPQNLGSRRQDNLMLEFRESDMTLVDSYDQAGNLDVGHVDSSYNQFILIDQTKNIVTLCSSPGDGTGGSRNNGGTAQEMKSQGVDLFRYDEKAGQDHFRGSDPSQWAEFSLVHGFAGNGGSALTSNCVGGFAETSTRYVSAYCYNGTGAYGDKAKVYLGCTTKSDLTSSYTEVSPKAGVTTPVLAATGLSGGYVMWNGKGNAVNDTLYYARYDADGTAGEVREAKGYLSDCQPIVYHGKVVWYATGAPSYNPSVPMFYLLDDSGVTAVQAGGSVSADPEPDVTEEPKPSAGVSPDPKPSESVSPDPKPSESQGAETPKAPISGTPVKPVSVALLNDANTTYSEGAFVSADGTATIGGVKVPGGPYRSVSGHITEGSTTYIWGATFVLLREDGTLWDLKGDTVAECAKAEPTRMQLEDVKQARVGVVLKKDGTLWTDYTTDGVSSVEKVRFMDGVKQFYSVNSNSLNVIAVKNDGSLWTWGFDVNGYGGYGDPWLGQSVTLSDAWWGPRKVMDNVAYATATMAIKTDGTLWSWGSNAYGAVGNGSTEDQAVPVKVLDDVIGAWCSYAGGRSQKYALTKDGTLYSWGDNSQGWLGYKEGDYSYTKAQGREYFQSTPRRTDITDVARVLEGGMVQKTDGSVWTITENGLGRRVAGSVMLTQVPIITAAASYTITSSAGTGGTVDCVKSAKKGETVTVTLTAGAGYEQDGAPTAKDANGNSVPLTSQGGGRYTFTMVEANVTIEAKFKPASRTNPFIDVKEGEYFYDPVLWAVEKGITTGTSTTTFSPYATCTRAQTVTFLWRAAGSPAPSSTRNPFTDVRPGDYFYSAVLWAVENGITNGTSATRFSPNDTVTRGQTVTFMYRSARSPSVSGYSPFTDVRTGEYYAEAVQWAVSKSITNGTSATTFGPNEGCTRGQIVTFLYRALA